MIQDEIIPSKNMVGWNAGQLWQLYEMQERGADWYCSASDGEYPQSPNPQDPKVARCMLVRYAREEGIETGFEKIEKKYHCPVPNGRTPKQFFTTYSYRSLTALKKNFFGMIVVPQNPVGMLPTAAANIHITQASDGRTQAEVIGVNAKKVTITLNADRWEVKR